MVEVIFLMLAPILLMGMGNFFTFFQPRWSFVPPHCMPAVLKAVFCINVLGCAIMGGIIGLGIGGDVLQDILFLLLGALIGAGIAVGMAWAGSRLHRRHERQVEELKQRLRNKRDAP